MIELLSNASTPIVSAAIVLFIYAVIEVKNIMKYTKQLTKNKN
jgi:hypothetical protein